MSSEEKSHPKEKEENVSEDLIPVPSCSYRALVSLELPSDSSATPSTSNAQKPNRKSFSERNYRRRSRLESSSSEEYSPVSNQSFNEAKRCKSSNNVRNILNEQSPPPNSGNAVDSDEDIGISDIERYSSNRDSNSTSSSSSQMNAILSPMIDEIFQRSGSESTDSDFEPGKLELEKMTSSIVDKKLPRHTWCSPRELMFREMGLAGNGKSSARCTLPNKIFENHAYGSLNSVRRLELMAKLEEHYSCVNCLNFSKSGRYLLSGSDDLRIVLWKWSTNKALRVLNTKHKKNIFQVKFVEEESGHFKIASASADGALILATLPSAGGQMDDKNLYTHFNAVHKIAVTTRNTILSAGEDGLVAEFDIRSRVMSKLVTVKEKKSKIPLFSISAHPVLNYFCVAGRDQFVRVYDRRNLKEVNRKFCPKHLMEQKSPQAFISSAVYNFNGREILASYSDESIFLFDSTDEVFGNYLHKYQGHANSATIKGVNFFGPRSEFVISGSDCSNIFFWDKKTEAICNWMRGDENGIVNVLEPHPHIPILATSGLDKDIKIWIPSNEEKVKLEGLEKCVYKNLESIVDMKNDDNHSSDRVFRNIARQYFRRLRMQHQSNLSNGIPLSFLASSSDSDSEDE